MQKVTVGDWRNESSGPVQVVSGPLGREKIHHHEAPPAEPLPEEMNRFLGWFENPGEVDPLLVAGLAHLWFVTCSTSSSAAHSRKTLAEDEARATRSPCGRGLLCARQT